jgi:hypothetical protein
LADKSNQLLLEALSRAVADPGGMPLYGHRKTPGLFSTSAAAKQAAQRCLADGYLRLVGNDTRGRSSRETYAITEKGLSHLLSQTSPKHVLEDLLRALDARQTQIGELVAAAQQWRAGTEELRTSVVKVLEEIVKPADPSARISGPTPSGNGSDAWLAEVVGCLSQRQASGASGDCPLPELYRRACSTSPNLSIGHFHDGLRRLHEQERIYLHPWTGPLYEISEPALALMIGHEIAYYASIRQVLGVSGQRSGVRGQRSEVRGQGSGVRGQGSGMRINGQPAC